MSKLADFLTSVESILTTDLKAAAPALAAYASARATAPLDPLVAAQARIQLAASLMKLGPAILQDEWNGLAAFLTK